MDRIQPIEIRARVPPNGAGASQAALSRSIAHVITTLSITTALEGMVKTEPVSNLMSDGVPKIIVCLTSTRNGRVKDAAPVIPKVLRSIRNVIGEVTVAEIPLKILKEVDVKSLITALI